MKKQQVEASPTQTIIEDSIKGGWEYRGIRKDNFKKVGRGSMDDDFELHSIYNSYLIPIERVLLDQKFWEAVGVTRGWSEVTEYCTSGCGCDPIDTCNINGDHPGAACERGYCDPEWLENQLKFIKALAQGLSIDEALKTLE